MACENHADLVRRLDAQDLRLDVIETTIQSLQIGAAAKDEQIKTVFVVLAEIKQMLKDYTIEMKGALLRLSSDIETMKGRPGRFFDGAVTAAIAALIGAFFMYILK